MDESKAQNLPLSGGRKDIPVGSGIRISPGDSGTDITAAVLDSTKASKTTNGLCIEDQGMAGCYCRFCNQPLEHLEPRSYNNESSLDRTESVNTNNEAGLFEEIMLGGYDLILNTKSHEETSEDDIGPTVGYGVSSQILRSTSRVFRAMFGPDSGFKETVNVRRAIIGLPASAAVISLDGDSEALGIVLKFLHHRVELLPTKVKFTKLVKIAEICNKYDLRQALKPLIDKLSKPFADKIYETGYEDWLLISYVFGYEDIFTKVSKELILQGILIPQQGFGFGDAGSYRTLSGCTPESVTSK